MRRGGRADVRDCEMLLCNIITSYVIMSRQKLAFVMEISGLHLKDILKWKIMPKFGTLTDVFLSDYMGSRILCVVPLGQLKR